MKKLLTAFLCIIMVAVFMPTMVFAAENTMTQAEFEAALENGSVDLGGKTVNVDSMISLTDKGNVSISNGTLMASDSCGEKVLAVQGNTNLKLEKVAVVAGASSNSAMYVGYEAKLDATNLTVDNSAAAKGGAIIINREASAVFAGSLSIKLGANSWYGINVDNAKANFDGADIKIEGAQGTQSVICSENSGNVSGAVMTEVKTGDGQNAYVSDELLAQFVAAKGTKVETITLNNDVELTQPLYLTAGTRVIGNGHTISGTEALGKDNVVTVTGDGVVLEDLKIKTSEANKSALHVYKAKNVVVKNVTLDVTKTVGGAGMVVNASEVKVEGSLDIVTGEKAWGGINVDTANGAAKVVFASASKITVNGNKNVSAIYQDKDQDAAVIEGAEEAGLVKNDDGSYAVKEEPVKPNPGTDDEDQPSDNDKNDKEDVKDEDKKDESVPETTDGSNALLWVAMMAVAAGAGVAVVIRKKAVENK